MPHKKSVNWLDLMMLGVECQQAIALRLLRLSRGGAHAHRESRLMVSEKMKAGMDAGLKLAGGASPQSVLKTYRTKVRANIRRLSK